MLNKNDASFRAGLVLDAAGRYRFELQTFTLRLQSGDQIQTVPFRTASTSAFREFFGESVPHCAITHRHEKMTELEIVSSEPHLLANGQLIVRHWNALPLGEYGQLDVNGYPKWIGPPCANQSSSAQPSQPAAAPLASEEAQGGGKSSEGDGDGAANHWGSAAESGLSLEEKMIQQAIQASLGNQGQEAANDGEAAGHETNATSSSDPKGTRETGSPIASTVEYLGEKYDRLVFLSIDMMAILSGRAIAEVAVDRTQPEGDELSKIKTRIERQGATESARGTAL